MKAPVLIVIFDFFVCSLLLSVSLQDSPSGGGHELAAAESSMSSFAPEEASEFSKEAIEADFLTQLARLDDAEQAIQEFVEEKKKEGQKKTEREKDEAEAELAATEAELKQADEKARKAQQDLEKSEKEKRELAAELAKFESQNQDLTDEKEKVEKDVQLTKEQLAEMTISLRRANAAAAQAEKEKKAQEDQLVALKKKLADSEKKVASIPGGSSPSSSTRPPAKALGQSALQGARLEVRVGITESDKGPDDKFDRTFYPVTFRNGSKTYILTNAQNFGLGWNGLEDLVGESDLRRFEFFLGSRGDGAASYRFYGDLHPLTIEKRLVFFEVPERQGAAKPLAFLGREKIGESRVQEGNLYKTNRSGEPMSVKFALDLSSSSSRYVLLTSEPITPREDKNAPKPELGDFIVTTDQHLVAIMIDNKRGLIIDSDLFESSENPISLNSRTRFMKDASQWKEALEK